MAPCFIAAGRGGAREELRFEDGEAGNPSATALWKLWDSGQCYFALTHHQQQQQQRFFKAQLDK